MFAVIDCGTTNTRIFILSEKNEFIAKGATKIGVRDTSITGSRVALKTGIETLYRQILNENNIKEKDIQFAIAAGMITSEIGLIEIPHLIAPVGIKELSENILIVNDPGVVDLGVPVYFIRGIKNNYGSSPTIRELNKIDFMRGEEVQCIGILKEMKPKLPVNIVVLSSHTKIIHIDENGMIASSMTTMSGQVFEAIKTATNIGKSLVLANNESDTKYSSEEIIETAINCVDSMGFVRSIFLPRFMEVLLETNHEERIDFIDAVIAADDMKSFVEFTRQGFASKEYILFGHEVRCDLYETLIHRYFGEDIHVTSVYDSDKIAELTVKGVIATSSDILAEND